MAKRTAHLLLMLACAGAAGAAWAQAWPAKPIRIVVPYPPGGYTDTNARAIGEPLGRALGVAVVVDNKPGANSILGADLVAKSAADGYTLVNVISAHAANATLYPKLPFDAIRDFAPVSLTSLAPTILVANNEFPARNLAEFLAYARANPGKVNFGSAGTGSAAHLTMEYLMGQTGTRMLHVPYKGTGPALVDLIGGQIGVMFDNPATMLAQVRAGKVKSFGITAQARLAAAADLPTFNEAGVPGFVAGSWTMLLAPAGTPPEVVNRLSREIARITGSPGYREKAEATGIVPTGSTPDEAAAFLRAEVDKWGKIIRDAGVKSES